MILKVFPSERGKGITVENKVVGGTIPKEYINACKSGVNEAMHNGIIAGYEVVDIHVDILDGSSHEVDSNENAFKMAAIFAVKDALKKAKCIMMEPIMQSRLPLLRSIRVTSWVTSTADAVVSPRSTAATI